MTMTIRFINWLGLGIYREKYKSLKFTLILPNLCAGYTGKKIILQEFLYNQLMKGIKKLNTLPCKKRWVRLSLQELKKRRYYHAMHP
jgi:hypothetical protein